MRNASARAVLDTVRLYSLRLTGVPQMLRQYLRHVAPLERVETKRGHRWRDKHVLTDTALRQAWTDLLTKEYEPILCRVVEYMDSHGLDSIWTAADAIEKQRCGDFKSLLATNEIKRFMGKEKERVPYLKRLQDIGFADTALAAISTAPRAA